MLLVKGCAVKASGVGGGGEGGEGGLKLTLLTVLFRLPSIGLMWDSGRPNVWSSGSESESETLPL